MVDHVDYLIAYAWHSASNARELVEYAHNKKVPTELIENTASKLRISNDKLRTSCYTLTYMIKLIKVIYEKLFNR